MLRLLGTPEFFISMLVHRLTRGRHVFEFRGMRGYGLKTLVGVPQGDPLSMLLFVVAYDILIWKMALILVTRT